jgi:hypothetical protein
MVELKEELLEDVPARRIGPLLSILLAADPSFVFLGRVSAQFSQGIALFLSFSS